MQKIPLSSLSPRAQAEVKAQLEAGNTFNASLGTLYRAQLPHPEQGTTGPRIVRIQPGVPPPIPPKPPHPPVLVSGRALIAGPTPAIIAVCQEWARLRRIGREIGRALQ